MIYPSLILIMWEWKKLWGGDKAVVQFDFSYDSDLNIVTLRAYLNGNDETIIDSINGVGFINANSEIDAIFNIDDTPILLSEIKTVDKINKCGLFARLFKAVALVATTVAVATAIVATVGVLAPAVIAVGVGITTTATTITLATTIATYSIITAAIAAGVSLTAELIESYYPGCGATTEIENGTSILYIKWDNQQSKQYVKDVVEANIKDNSKDPAIYFKVEKYYNGGPTRIEANPYKRSVMSINMKNNSWSSLTFDKANASLVIKSAFPLNVIYDDRSHGMYHYHAVASNGTHLKGLNNLFVVHSFYIV